MLRGNGGAGRGCGSLGWPWRLGSAAASCLSPCRYLGWPGLLLSCWGLSRSARRAVVPSVGILLCPGSGRDVEGPRGKCALSAEGGC